MKIRILLLVTLMTISQFLFGQIPNYFDLEVQLKERNVPLRDVFLDLKISIFCDGNEVYTEVLSKILTNYDGWVQLKIGQNNQTAFANINWQQTVRTISIFARDFGTTGTIDRLVYSNLLETVSQAQTAKSLDFPFSKKVSTDKNAFDITNEKGYSIVGQSVNGLGDGVKGIVLPSPTNDEDNHYAGIRAESKSKGGMGLSAQHISGTYASLASNTYSGSFSGGPVKIDVANDGPELIISGPKSSFLEFSLLGGNWGRIGFQPNFQNINIENFFPNSKIILDAPGGVQIHAGEFVVENGPLKVKGFGRFGSEFTFNFFAKHGPIKGGISNDPYYYTQGSSPDGPSLGTAQGDPGNTISIFSDGRIVAPEFNAISDIRIKKLINKCDAINSTNIITNLNVYKYSLIDNLMSRDNPKYGFIAQDVEHLLPEATSVTTNVIPDIYKICTNIICDSVNKQLSITINQKPQLKVDEKVKIFSKIGNYLLQIIEVTDTSFTVKDWPEKDTKEVFVYGKEVNDFRVVDYNQIFALNVSATQALIQEVNDLKAKLFDQDNLINQVMEKLLQLEANLAKIDKSVDAPGGQR